MAKRLSALIATSVLCLPVAAHAVPVNMQALPAKDASLANGPVAGMNLGGGAFIVYNWYYNLRSIGLVEFDLSGLAGGGDMSSATLSLFHAWNPCSGCRYDIFRVTSAWDEYAVTFDAAPGYDPTAVPSLVIDDDSQFLFRYWDVTPLVAGWLGGTYPNYGIWIEEVEVQGSAIAYFLSSDWNPDLGPRLTAEFTSVPEPGTLALLGLGLAGLGIARRRKNP